jgi:hypothetical protein
MYGSGIVVIESTELNASRAEAAALEALDAQTAAEASAAAALMSETNADASESSSIAARDNALAYATAANLARDDAQTAEANAEDAETGALAAQEAAELAYDDFDDRYLGAKSYEPTVDNDGDALITGALYFNTTDDYMKVWDGAAWNNAYADFSSLGTAAEADIIGTVSESAGVPTGAIIERGSNANGEYVRYADGTQICTRISLPLSTTLSPWGSAAYISGEVIWTFPAPFSHIPAVSGSAGDSNHLSLLTVSSVGAVSTGVRSITPASSITSNHGHVTAIGRWF